MAPVVPQVSKQEAQLKAMREAQEERVRGMTSEATQLQGEIAALKSSAASLAADMATRKALVTAELDALQRCGGGACPAQLVRHRAHHMR